MGEHASDPRFAAFYGLLVVEWRLGERLDAELEAAAGLSLNQLELLLHLHWSDGPAADVRARGGAAALARRGDAARGARRGGGAGDARVPPDDRRATYAVLTDGGREAAERGFPVYVEAVQRLFQDFVTDEEAEMLVRVWNRVLEGNGLACAPITEAAAALDARAAGRPISDFASARDADVVIQRFGRVRATSFGGG